MKEKLLFKNKWIQVLELDDWYTIYRHNGTNHGVAILGLDGDKVLIRVENCLPHGGFVETSITGTVEEGMTPLQTAVMELKEETGFVASEDEFIDLGWIYPSKASDMKMNLYAVNLSGKEQGSIDGDGTKGEDGASVKWVPMHEACFNRSPSISAMLMRYMMKSKNMSESYDAMERVARMLMGGKGDHDADVGYAIQKLYNKAFQTEVMRKLQAATKKDFEKLADLVKKDLKAGKVKEATPNGILNHTKDVFLKMKIESRQIKEGIDVSKKKYSWGVLRKIEVGHSYSIIMHPEVWEDVEKVLNGSKDLVRIKSEDGQTYMVSGDKNSLKFKGTGGGVSSTIALNARQVSVLECVSTARPLNHQKRLENLKKLSGLFEGHKKVK